MTRPRIICHMHTLLNGKIDGIANPTAVGMRSQKLYFDLFLGKERAFTGHRGWLSGSGTSDAIMGGRRDVELPRPSAPVPPGDHLAEPEAEMFYFAVDGSARLAWDRSSFEYFDVTAHIVELLPRSASDALKAHLRATGVSYLLAGDDELDMDEAVRKIGEIFGVDELILGGGGTVNWSMLRAGLCDEISLVLMPTADAENHTYSLFEANERFAPPAPVAFSLRSVDVLEDDSVWLRYDVGEVLEEPTA
ncbi:dihydrofolate reductase family protein [Brachybacterium saurashtrense]|uniref:Pyrimidine reductase n=1 Tax=Brachybacterium saurashtrense TaxID=556288 RepID=A0A345YK44_9MICO|nr:dihydrofolate reductase family protein [Brachybacterium saurashtrense]AXK44296.1 pyrimidine reductase [Brachybacterium saurashtrense]RRR21332.1 pyrimidine reductase [Brachybacterium saurashtrense]RRR22907.1 pyrimidine reductase [Brachybacterium saurashtrense]